MVQVSMLSDEWLPRYRLLENFTAKWNRNGNGNGNAYDQGDYNSSFALRAVELKIPKAELWFLCMTHCLIVLYNCIKFHLNNFNGCQLTERTRNSIANDQREITP